MHEEGKFFSHELDRQEGAVNETTGVDLHAPTGSTPISDLKPENRSQNILEDETAMPPEIILMVAKLLEYSENLTYLSVGLLLSHLESFLSANQANSGSAVLKSVLTIIQALQPEAFLAGLPAILIEGYNTDLWELARWQQDHLDEFTLNDSSQLERAEERVGALSKVLVEKLDILAQLVTRAQGSGVDAGLPLDSPARLKHLAKREYDLAIGCAVKLRWLADYVIHAVNGYDDFEDEDEFEGEDEFDDEFKMDILLDELKELLDEDINPFRMAELCTRILELDDASHTLTIPRRDALLSLCIMVLKEHAMSMQYSAVETVGLMEQILAFCNMALAIRDATGMPKEHAEVQIEKGDLLQVLAAWPGNDTIDLLGQAITCYDAALVIYDSSSKAQEYTDVQMKKGNALISLAEQKQGGEAIEKLEQAVACYDAAQMFYATKSMARKHAEAQINMGNALVALAEYKSDERETTRALEQAIACYNAALGACDSGSMAHEYAEAQMKKGNTLRLLAVRLRREQAVILLEQAIVCYDAALAICEPESMSHEYAEAQEQKGDALQILAGPLRISEGMILLGQAVACYDAALTFYDTTTISSLAHAHVQMKKGKALQELADITIPGEEAIVFLKAALICYDIALEINDPKNLASDHAHAQVGKAIILGRLVERQEKKKARSTLRRALDCFSKALEVCSRANLIAERASILLDKGSMLYRLVERWNGAMAITLLEQAIACYEEALVIFDRLKMPAECTEVLENESEALLLLARQGGGVKMKHLLERAVTCLEDVLAFYPQAIRPERHRSVALRLAQARMGQALLSPDHKEALTQLERASEVAITGLEAAGILERLAFSLEFRQAEWGENSHLYDIAGTIQALRGSFDEAVALLEAGRARGLAEARGRGRINLSILSPAELQEYSLAVMTVLDIEARSRRVGNFRHSAALAKEARTANAALESLIKRFKEVHPEFVVDFQPSIPLFTSKLYHAEVLIYLVAQENGTLLLLIPQTGEPQAKWLSEITEDRLYDLAIRIRKRGKDVLGYLPTVLGAGTTSLDEALDVLLPALGEQLMRLVVQMARDLNAQRAVLIVGGTLAILPLHAATYLPLSLDDDPTAPLGRRYACDDLVITYAPSAAAFIAARTDAERIPKVNNGLVVGNPKLSPANESRWEPGMPGYLPYAEAEARSVAEIMREAGITVNCKIAGEATWNNLIEGLRSADIAHLALHAIYEYDPLDSALVVAPRAKLSLRDLFDPRVVSLQHLRLVVLSACQSGFTDFRKFSDEGVGIFGALMAAGAVGVVGSLWSIYDYPTKQLMESFTKRYLQGGQEPAVALRNAARWLRGLADETTGVNGLTQVSDGNARQSGAVNGDFAIARQQSEESRVAEPAIVRQLSLRSDSQEESTIATRRSVSLEHPTHWAAFVYYGV